MLDNSDDSVTLVAYDDGWPAWFQREAQQLEEAGLPGFLAAEHIGSTAVPGMRAKPILDIVVTVDIPAGSPRLIRALASLGYRYLGTFGLRGRHFFRKGEPAKVHLHVVQQGSPHRRAWIDFRDALRASPAWLELYQHQKEELAALYREDRAAYTAAKGPIVASVLAAAHPRKKRGRTTE